MIDTISTILITKKWDDGEKSTLSYTGATVVQALLFFYGQKTHRSRGQSRDVKKMQGETEGAVKVSTSRASKQAPI